MIRWSNRFIHWYYGGLVGFLQVIVEVVNVVGGSKSVAGEATLADAGLLGTG